MDLDQHYRNLERMYLSAPLHEQYPGLSIKISEEEATLGLPVSERYFHAAMAMHGSVYFKLLDDAAFFAVNSIVTDVFVLTTQFNIQLFRPVTSGHLTSVGKLTFKSRQLFSAESNLYNDKGKLVATGTGQFMRSKLLLEEQMGYSPQS